MAAYRILLLSFNVKAMTQIVWGISYLAKPVMKILSKHMDFF